MRIAAPEIRGGGFCPGRMGRGVFAVSPGHHLFMFFLCFSSYAFFNSSDVIP